VKNGGPSRALIVVLIVQVVIATIFIVLVATNSIPLPSASLGANAPKLSLDG
jgi:hypothetical protein